MMAKYQVIVSCVTSVLVPIDVEADNEDAAMDGVAARIDAGEEIISRSELSEIFDQQVAKHGDYDVDIADVHKI